jgi:hypothetical protein
VVRAVPCELTTDHLAPLFADCADRAEHLRRTGANVVLVTGCELTLFGAGFLPGGTVYERIQGLQSGSGELYAAFAALPGKLNGFLAATAEAARSRFAGPLTYASGMWEPVDWAPFDIAATDAYRDASNAGTFRSELRKQLQCGKPLAVTEFGCCGYAGASGHGQLWSGEDAARWPQHRLPRPRLGTQARLRRTGRGGRVAVELIASSLSTIGRTATTPEPNCARRRAGQCIKARARLASASRLPGLPGHTAPQRGGRR